MTYQEPFVKMTLSGTTCDENEIFNTGLHIGNTNSGSDPYTWFAQLGLLLPDLAQVWVDHWDEAALKIPFDATLTAVKIALIGTDGKYLEADPIEVEVNQFGAYNGAYSPQDARVVTFASSKRKDPGKYNRMYIPSGGNTEANAYQLTTAEQTAYATVFQTIIELLNDVLSDGGEGPGARVSVISGQGEGHQRDVDFIRVGSLVDTQRRRRNKLPENYVTVPVANA